MEAEEEEEKRAQGNEALEALQGEKRRPLCVQIMASAFINGPYPPPPLNAPTW